MTKMIISIFAILASFSTAQAHVAACFSVFNGENYIELHIEKGVITSAESFIDFSRSYGNMVELKKLTKDRVRFAFESENVSEVFDLDNSILETGKGSIYSPDQDDTYFECQ